MLLVNLQERDPRFRAAAQQLLPVASLERRARHERRTARRAPTVDLPLPDTPATITIIAPRLRPVSGPQPEWRVTIGDQDERVPEDAVVPANHALHVVEDAARIAPGEQDGEPGDDDRDHCADMQEG